jgi:hypothetical protein
VTLCASSGAWRTGSIRQAVLWLFGDGAGADAEAFLAYVPSASTSVTVPKAIPNNKTKEQVCFLLFDYKASLVSSGLFEMEELALWEFFFIVLYCMYVCYVGLYCSVAMFLLLYSLDCQDEKL